jgi:hypothetical protein
MESGHEEVSFVRFGFFVFGSWFLVLGFWFLVLVPGFGSWFLFLVFVFLSQHGKTNKRTKN